MIIIKKILPILMFCLLAACSPEQTEPAFVFSAIPDEDVTRLQERFGKVADYLERELGVPVKYVPVTSYAAAVTAFRNNQVQLAWFGGLSGVQARERAPGAQAIAQGYEDQEFLSYFIANAATGLERSKDFPAEIAGMNFTFGAKDSTSGRLMPEYYIRKHFGKPPEAVFRRVGFSGNHSRTIALVQSGAYQAGAVNYTVWENEVDAGNVDPKKVSIIWVTPPYPDYQWTIRPDVNETWGEGFKQRVTEALLGMDEKAPELLETFPRSRFVPAENSDYAPIRETGREIGLLDE